MKNVTLLIHDDQGQEARLQAALDITRALDGHLTCVDVAILPIALAGDFYDGGTGTAFLLEMERERESKNRAEIEGRLAKEGLPWTWIDTTDSLAEGVIAASPLTDLVVLNRKLDLAGPNMADVTSRIVTQLRKPVIAVPDGLRRLELGRALIAWDGQASCAATMRACVPLLALAGEVEIFVVRNGSEQTAPEEAAEYLSRHNIHAEIRVVEDDRTRVDELIAQEVERFGADYVLMGAYGHGRLMETFGGVTKRMLAASKVPLVLGH